MPTSTVSFEYPDRFKVGAMDAGSGAYEDAYMDMRPEYVHCNESFGWQWSAAGHEARKNAENVVAAHNAQARSDRWTNATVGQDTLRDALEGYMRAVACNATHLFPTTLYDILAKFGVQDK